MLVLSRRINESIQIGHDIEVMVIDVHGDIARLGITAPQSTPIWRKELWDTIVQENRAAADAAKSSEAMHGAAIQMTPRLPVSAFSPLSRIPTVHPNEKE